MTEQFNKEEYDKQYEKCLLDTYKKEDGDTDYTQWAYDCIEDIVNDMWYDHVHGWEFETEEDYAPYGDTFVSTGSYITDEEEEKCRRNFKGNVGVEEICKELLKSHSFQVLVKKIVANVAEDSDIDV